VNTYRGEEVSLFNFIVYCIQSLSHSLKTSGVLVVGSVHIAKSLFEKWIVFITKKKKNKEGRIRLCLLHTSPRCILLDPFAAFVKV